jgi:hypothetical protein
MGADNQTPAATSVDQPSVATATDEVLAELEKASEAVRRAKAALGRS